jgi:hypothetical protein
VMHILRINAINYDLASSMLDIPIPDFARANARILKVYN